MPRPGQHIWRNRIRQAAVYVVGVALLAGCATRADLIRVKDDMRLARAQLADQQVALEGLRRRVEILRSEMSEPGHKKESVAASNEMAVRLNDLEVRLVALEQASAALPPSTPGERPFEPQVQPTSAPPKPQSQQEVALAKEEAALPGARVDGDYREALQLIRQGQCNQAVPKLRDFIRKNPKSELADNAQYWIGSCYYGQRDYNRAIIELNEVLLKYPKADKVPAALLILADSFADSGDKIDARLILQKLISDHPKSEEAERGRQKLQSLSD